MLILIDPPCPDVCPLDYSPVCGTDGQTYSNQCQLQLEACNTNNAQLRIAYAGICAVSRGMSNGKAGSTSD